MGMTTTDGSCGVLPGVMKAGCSKRIILWDVVARRWLHSFIPRLPNPPVMAIVFLLLLVDAALMVRLNDVGRTGAGLIVPAKIKNELREIYARLHVHMGTRNVQPIYFTLEL